MLTFLLYALELRHHRPPVPVLEANPNQVINRHLLRARADYVREHCWPFVKLNDGQHIGRMGVEGFERRLVHDRIADYDTGATRVEMVEFGRPAFRTPSPWIVDCRAAVPATLQAKHALPCGIPIGAADIGRKRRGPYSTARVQG